MYSIMHSKTAMNIMIWSPEQSDNWDQYKRGSTVAVYITRTLEFSERWRPEVEDCIMHKSAFFVSMRMEYSCYDNVTQVSFLFASWELA